MAMTDSALQKALADLRPRLVRGGLREDLLTEAFAYLREASRRTLGLRHHPVQLLAAFVLIEGKLAEMQTGEGKTIVAGLAAATAALAGTPVHVITINDYLAVRDADAIRPLLTFAGLTVGAIEHDHPPDKRRHVYGCDVSYASNKEIAFDYLRDRVSLAQASSSGLGQSRFGQIRAPSSPIALRGLHFGIVDEADNILIDEARTPLILARASPERGDRDLHRTALAIADRLVKDVHFQIEPGSRRLSLTAEGRTLVAQAVHPAAGFWRARHAREDLIGTALAARHLYWRDRDYVVLDGAVQIVDENTGRIAEGRSWQNGLHQLIELIEGVPPSDRNETRASITYQSFFRRYLKLGGMSGTLTDVVAEMRYVYRLATVRIATHRPVDRRRTSVRLLGSSEAKWQAVVKSAGLVAATNRPVLIGTRTVAASDTLSNLLAEAGLDHVVLNARQDQEEAAIVAQAGLAGRITVVTAMAGRGTDIRPDASVIRAGGLHVILTELHESRRTDRQLIGRGGRQGDPSTFELCLSLDDEIFRAHAPRWTTLVRALALAGAASPLAARWLQKTAQGAAERRHRRAREQVMNARLRLQKDLAFAGSDL